MRVANRRKERIACLSTSSTPEKQTDMILNLVTTDAADTKIGDQSI